MAVRFVESRAASYAQAQAQIRHALRAIFARLPDTRTTPGAPPVRREGAEGDSGAFG